MNARIVWDTVHGHQRRRFYVVECTCGRENKFWRWSWLTRGAERCRGCHAIVMAPTVLMFALKVVAVDDNWRAMSFDEQAAFVRALATGHLTGGHA